jgi:hypothetical protein
MALLQDCCGAATLPPIERALAQNALDWLRSVGIDPLPTPNHAKPFQVEGDISY